MEDVEGPFDGAQDDRLLSRPSPGQASAQDDRSVQGSADGPDPIVTGRNGKLQRKRRTRRRLFGKTAKAAFLESFACTANAAASAAAVGFGVGTVFTHRRKDAEFREDYWVALEQAVAKLAGRFPELEDQLCGMVLGGGYQGPGRSPDRADAMVWAMTELMLSERRAEPRISVF